MRLAIALLAGLIAGFVCTASIQALSIALYPAPVDLDLTQPEAVAQWIEQLPVGAFLLVLLSHALGAFMGAAICQAIAGTIWRPGWMVIGVLFLAAGIYNLIEVPHPIWFAIADVITYIPAAWIGGSTLARLFGSPN